MFTILLSFGRKVQLLCCLLLLIAQLHAQTPVLGFNAVTGITLNTPIEAVHAGDGSNRLFIVQKGGLIRIYDGTAMLATPFLDISSIIATDGERGLLSLAFPPDYATNHYFFVYYTNTSGAITVARYKTPAGTPNVADGASGVVLLTISKTESNHNGGHLQFGPEGYLYFGTGDGGGGGDVPNNAQNGNSLLGKMIRLNVNDSTDVAPYYVIPEDNPFVDDPTVRDEIWAIGLRNPFRWSFDRVTHDMWIGDVGQGAREEIDFRADGATGGINYGWRCYEGDLSYNTSGCGTIGSYTFPIFDYARDNATGGQCVTGGVVYRGSLWPSLQGYYMCADYLSNNGWLIKRDGAGVPTVTLQAGMPDGLVSFSEAENGEVYAVSLNNNAIYQVSVAAVLPLTLEQFSGKAKNSSNELAWNTSSEMNVSTFEVEYSINGADFKKAGSVTASNLAQGKAYTFTHTSPPKTVLFYRLKMIDKDQHFSYSYIIKVENNYTQTLAVIPSLLKQGEIMTIGLKVPFSKLEITDMNGQVLINKQLSGTSGDLKIDLSSFAKGIYLVRLVNTENSITKRILVQ